MPLHRNQLFLLPILTPLVPAFHSAAALFLPASALHHFADISYEHNPYQTCPTDIAKYHDTGKCQVSGAWTLYKYVDYGLTAFRVCP